MFTSTHVSSTAAALLRSDLRPSDVLGTVGVYTDEPIRSRTCAAVIADYDIDALDDTNVVWAHRRFATRAQWNRDTV